MLSYNTNIIKSIQIIELFQLLQVIIIQDITVFCGFKNENIFRSFTTTKNWNLILEFFSCPATVITWCYKKKTQTDQV